MTRRGVERAALAGAVLVLHAALLWGWRSGPAVPRADVHEPTPLRVQLLPLAKPVEASPVAVQTVASRLVERRPNAPLPMAGPTTEPTTAPTITVPSAPERSASAPVDRPLDTALPTAIARPNERSLKDRLLNDPRSNSARATVETRVAAAAGTVEMVEERMDATRLRVRQRGGCIEVHVSRNAQIDPFNQSHLPTPKLVKPDC